MIKTATNEVTDEPITHMIYSHHHKDHIGAAGQIFPENITCVSHKQTADVLVQENDPEFMAEHYHAMKDYVIT